MGYYDEEYDRAVHHENLTHTVQFLKEWLAWVCEELDQRKVELKKPLAEWWVREKEHRKTILKYHHEQERLRGLAESARAKLTEEELQALLKRL